MREIDRMSRMERRYMTRIEQLTREGIPFRACLHQWGYEFHALYSIPRRWKDMPKFLHAAMRALDKSNTKLVRRGVLMREDIFDGTELKVTYERSW